jgi:hypothetical protein
VGDLSDLAAEISPRPLWLAGLVDGHHRPVAQAQLDRLYAPARQGYAAAGAASKFLLGQQPVVASTATWLQTELSASAAKR